MVGRIDAAIDDWQVGAVARDCAGDILDNRMTGG